MTPATRDDASPQERHGKTPAKRERTETAAETAIEAIRALLERNLHRLPADIGAPLPVPATAAPRRARGLRFPFSRG